MGTSDRFQPSNSSNEHMVNLNYITLLTNLKESSFQISHKSLKPQFTDLRADKRWSIIEDQTEENACQIQIQLTLQCSLENQGEI